MRGKKDILLQPRHLVREKEPRMEDFKLNSSFSNMPIKVYDETAYQRAMDEFKERNPEEIEYDWMSYNNFPLIKGRSVYVKMESGNIYHYLWIIEQQFWCNELDLDESKITHWCDAEDYDAKVKAYEESRIFYEGFEKAESDNDWITFHKMSVNYLEIVGFKEDGLDVNFMYEKRFLYECGDYETEVEVYFSEMRTLYLWEAITGLKPKET